MNKVKFLGIGTRGKVATVRTKYGETVVYADDVVTYVGNDIWSVCRY